MACNNIDNLVPRGNDFYIAAQLKYREKEGGQIVQKAFDFEACDNYDARIYDVWSDDTLGTLVGLKDGTTDTVVIDAKNVPVNKPIAVEVKGELDGRAFRAAERGFIGIVEFNGEARVVFTPITGGQQANLVMIMTFLPSAAVVGENAFEIWKQEPGNEDKTLADFIYFLGHGESAYEIAVRYGYTGTEEEYNALYFNAVQAANDAAALANQKAGDANNAATAANNAAESANIAADRVDGAITNMQETLNGAIAEQNAEIASKEAEIDATLAEQTGIINQKQLEIGAVPSDSKPMQGSTNWVTSNGINNADVTIADYASGVMGFDVIPNTNLLWAQGVINSTTGAIASSTKRCYITVPISGKLRKIQFRSIHSSYFIHTVVEYSTSTIGTDSFVRTALAPVSGTYPSSFSITTSNYVVVVVARTDNNNLTATDAGDYTVVEQATDNLNIKGLQSIQGAGKITDITQKGWIVGRLSSSGSNETSSYHIRSSYIRDSGIIELYAGESLYIDSVFIYNSSAQLQSTVCYDKSLERCRFTVASTYIFRVVLKRRDGSAAATTDGDKLVGSIVEANSRLFNVEAQSAQIDYMLNGGEDVQIPLQSGYYWSLSSSAKVSNSAYSCSDPYPVSFGQKIKVTLSVGNDTYAVWGGSSTTFLSNGVTLISRSTEVTNEIITIPEGVNYIFISSRNENFSPSFTPSAYKTANSWIDEKIATAINNTAVVNPLNGLKLIAIGDSITHGQVMDGTAPTKPFPVLVSEALGMDLVNYGIGGSTIGTCANYGGTFASLDAFNAATKDTSKYYVVMTGNQTYTDYAYNGSSWATTNIQMRTPLVDRCNLMDNDADVILVAGGTNDFQYNWASIGTITDTTTGTFYGDLNLLCSRLITRYPQKCIIFMTPIKRCQTQLADSNKCDTTAHRGGSYGTIDSQNNFGKTLADYGSMIKEVCARYSIPVIDMYSESMLNPQLSAQSSLFDSYKTHPYQAGHNLMARLIVGKIRSIFGMYTNS